MTSISLGEGNSPLIKLNNLKIALKWPGELWAKCEFLNPTGSFKDRGSLTEVTQAIKLGKKGLVCASTGNMAASLSAYAARAKLKCVVFVPETTPTAKLNQAIICGAKLKKAKGSYDTCVSQAKTFAKKNNYLLCGDYELRRLGQSTVGLELAKSDINFDAFIVPVGNGTLGCAIAQGFSAYGQFPQFIGVQGKGADPIAKAWKNKTLIKPINAPKTVASAMNVGNPLDGQLTLEWVNRTKGEMLSVSNQEIASAKKLLAQTEGIFVESATAATLAGLLKIPSLTPQATVLILTGTGLKERG